MSKAIIFTVGGHTSMIPTIREEDPDFCYFIHSDESKEQVDEIIKEMGFNDSDFACIKVKPFDLNNVFVLSKIIIDEINNNYSEIKVDYTGGTKLMSVGLALAASTYGVGVNTHKSLGVHSKAIHKASIVSAFTCLGCSFINALIDGADSL